MEINWSFLLDNFFECYKHVELKHWSIGKLEGKNDRRMKRFNFSCVCLVRGEKWEDGKLFWLVENKNKMMKNIVCTNLLLCPYSIKHYILFLLHYPQIYKYIWACQSIFLGILHKIISYKKNPHPNLIIFPLSIQKKI